MKRYLIVSACAAALVGLAACGDGDGTTEVGQSEPVSAAPPEPAPPQKASASTWPDFVASVKDTHALMASMLESAERMQQITENP